MFSYVSPSIGFVTADGNKIQITNEMDPANIKWGDMGVDYVIESTGKFLDDEGARKHIAGGAKKVVFFFDGFSNCTVPSHSPSCNCFKDKNTDSSDSTNAV